MRKSAVLLSVFAAVAPVAIADISYPNFDSAAGLQLNGSAAAPVFDGTQNVLRLTPSQGSQAGSAFSVNKVSLASDASFSSVFSFRLSNPQNGGADGIVFVVQNVANNVGGLGGGLGYFGIQNSIGVEFDTFDNDTGAGDGPTGGLANHVAIDTNGTFDTLGTPLPGGLGEMDQGGIYHAWVDYNGATDTMEVRISDTGSRPGSALVTRTSLDIPQILGGATDAFVGFTGATGAAYNDQDILSWGLTGAFNPFPDANPTPRNGAVPEAAPFIPVVALGLGVTALQIWRRRKKA